MDLCELSGRLSIAKQLHCRLQEHFEKLQPCSDNRVPLLDDIRELQSVISALQAVIEDPQFTRFASSSDCVSSLIKASQSLCKYNSSIDTFRTHWNLLPLGEYNANMRLSQNYQTSEVYKAMRDNVNDLWRQLSITTAMANW